MSRYWLRCAQSCGKALCALALVLFLGEASAGEVHKCREGERVNYQAVECAPGAEVGELAGVVSFIPGPSAPGDSLARPKGKRSRAAVAGFKRLHPCPSTGERRGSCPGWVVDHVVALACGGPDAVENMQWQTAKEAKAKDRVELYCR